MTAQMLAQTRWACSTYNQGGIAVFLEVERPDGEGEPGGEDHFPVGLILPLIHSPGI